MVGEHLLVVLKAYLDGGNQPDSQEYKNLTLAAVVGEEEQWNKFEVEWRSVLDRYEVDYLHTTDAVAMDFPYSKDEGWVQTKRDAFVFDCVVAISHHLKSNWHEGLYVYTFTVPLADFVRARRENPDVPETASEICAIQTANQIFEWGSGSPKTIFHCTFDRGETFLTHLRNRSENHKSKRLYLAYSRLTTTEADMRITPALQCADLFAWCYSHKDEGQRFCWQAQLMQLFGFHQTADYQMLLHPNKEVVDAWRLCKLPKHHRHR